MRFIKVPAALLLDPRQASGSDIHAADLSDLLGRFGIDLIAGPSEVLVIADARRCFYPPALCGLGYDLRRLLFLRASRQEGLQSAVVQCLACPAVGAVPANPECA